MQTTTEILRQRMIDNKQSLSTHIVKDGIAYHSEVSRNTNNLKDVSKLGGTGKANKLVNVQAQMDRIENTIIDVIDFRALRKSGALRR